LVKATGGLQKRDTTVDSAMFAVDALCM